MAAHAHPDGFNPAPPLVGAGDDGTPPNPRRSLLVSRRPFGDNDGIYRRDVTIPTVFYPRFMLDEDTTVRFFLGLFSTLVYDQEVHTLLHSSLDVCVNTCFTNVVDFVYYGFPLTQEAFIGNCRMIFMTISYLVYVLDYRCRRDGNMTRPERVRLIDSKIRTFNRSFKRFMRYRWAVPSNMLAEFLFNPVYESLDGSEDLLYDDRLPRVTMIYSESRRRDWDRLGSPVIELFSDYPLPLSMDLESALVGHRQNPIMVEDPISIVHLVQHDDSDSVSSEGEDEPVRRALYNSLEDVADNDENEADLLAGESISHDV